MHAVEAILVVQVHTSYQPGRPNITDRLSLPYARPGSGTGGKLRHVCVQRRDIAAMLQDDGVAIPRFHATKDNLAVTGGFYRRSARRCVIHAAVRPACLQNRVQAIRVE